MRTIFNREKADTVAAASAECGLEKFGYHLPDDLRACLRANLYDLCWSCLLAYFTAPPKPLLAVEALGETA